MGSWSQTISVFSAHAAELLGDPDKCIKTQQKPLKVYSQVSSIAQAKAGKKTARYFTLPNMGLVVPVAVLSLPRSSCCLNLSSWWKWNYLKSSLRVGNQTFAEFKMLFICSRLKETEDKGGEWHLSKTFSKENVTVEGHARSQNRCDLKTNRSLISKSKFLRRMQTWSNLERKPKRKTKLCTLRPVYGRSASFLYCCKLLTNLCFMLFKLV